MRPSNAEERIQARYIPAGFTIYRQAAGGIVYAAPDKMRAIAYRGTAMRHEWHYRFRSLSEFEQTCDGFFESLKAHEEFKQKRANDRKNFEVKIKVGDIIDTSWGYDQTNVEFFQVVHISGKLATVREIAQHETEQTGPFSSRVEAVRDQFLTDSKEIRCRIQFPGDSMNIEGHGGSLWDGHPVHSSWGA
jgi:hypothetical protein